MRSAKRAASQLPGRGGQLLWILPLYLHVNKKSDDDDDDDLKIQNKMKEYVRTDPEQLAIFLVHDIDPSLIRWSSLGATDI